MRCNPKRLGEKAQQMNAAAIALDAQRSLFLLATPVEPTDTIKARRERAIRRAGLSSAKGTRLWYGQACALLAHEYVQLKEAYRNHITSQKARLAEEIEYLRALQAKENQHELGLPHERARQDAMGPA
jgi:hypothetical protein